VTPCLNREKRTRRERKGERGYRRANIEEEEEEERNRREEEIHR
jgi:hypothetical protein